eukprot:2262186-Pleurochrysis_carterae.AAC.6
MLSDAALPDMSVKCACQTARCKVRCRCAAELAAEGSFAVEATLIISATSGASAGAAPPRSSQRRHLPCSALSQLPNSALHTVARPVLLRCCGIRERA